MNFTLKILKNLVSTLLQENRLRRYFSCLLELVNLCVKNNGDNTDITNQKIVYRINSVLLKIAQQGPNPGFFGYLS